MIVDTHHIFEFFSSVEVAALISAFISWGLMMALLFNLVSNSNPLQRVLSPLKLCLVINVSYLATSFINVSLNHYLLWAVADITTAILIALMYVKKEPISAWYYCMYVLLANAAMHLLLYYDLYYIGTLKPWWYWSFYPIAINTNDIILIVALILNRDFLGLVRGINFLKNKLLINKVRSYV